MILRYITNIGITSEIRTYHNTINLPTKITQRLVVVNFHSQGRSGIFIAYIEYRYCTRNKYWSNKTETRILDLLDRMSTVEPWACCHVPLSRSLVSGEWWQTSRARFASNPELHSLVTVI